MRAVLGTRRLEVSQQALDGIWRRLRLLASLLENRLQGHEPIQEAPAGATSRRMSQGIPFRELASGTVRGLVEETLHVWARLVWPVTVEQPADHPITPRHLRTRAWRAR